MINLGKKVRNDDGLEPEYSFFDGVFESSQRNLRVDLRGEVVWKIKVADFTALYVDTPCIITLGDNCKVHIVDDCTIVAKKNCWVWGRSHNEFLGGENSYFMVRQGNYFLDGVNNSHIINGLNIFNSESQNFVMKSKRKTTIGVRVPIGRCLVNRIEPKHLSEEQVKAMKKNKEQKKILNSREDSLIYSRGGVEFNKIPERIAF